MKSLRLALYLNLCKNLLSWPQLGFEPNDSTANQLISISHSMFSAHDANPSSELRDILYDLSKELDRF